tara:strand:- start:1023 stop:2306 length:1284 start_codon:yes stop_codon:yes gene_type:complete
MRCLNYYILLFLSYTFAIAYPDFDIIVNNNPYPQDIFLHSTGQGGTGFVAILDPELQVKWYVMFPDGKGWDFKVNNNHKLTYFKKPSNTWTPSGGGIWHVMDQSMYEVDTLACVNNIDADYHDIQYTDTGGYILQAYAKQEIDLPQTEAIDTANVLILQEFDQNHNLIMEWRNFDHMNIYDYLDHINLNSPYRHWMHGNSIEIDDDGHIFVSNRTMSELIKFNRETGELIWRLGGPMNDFTFIDDPLFGPNRQHDARRLENGNIMIFDNGDQRDDPLTRITEYEINEQEMTATLVWSYSHPSGYVSLNQGCAQRLENGNTLIAWGGVSGHGQLITEVEYDGTIVLELEYPISTASYKVRKSDWEFNINLTESDINLDENIDIFDLILVVNFILSDAEPQPFHLYKSDLNRDGQVNIDDVILMLGAIV